MRLGEHNLDASLLRILTQRLCQLMQAAFDAAWRAVEEQSV